MTDLKNIERCVLCLDEKRSPVRIQCGHSFCNECLTVYKSYQKYAWANKCPICRGLLKDKKRTSHSSLNNQNRHGSATSADVSSSSAEQTFSLEEFIAIATDEYRDQEDRTHGSSEFGDDVQMIDSSEDQGDGDNYFADSDEDSYYYFEEDEDYSDQQASIVDVEDYEAEVMPDSEVTFLTNDGGIWSRISASLPQPIQSTNSDVVIVDDIIIVD